MQTALFSRRPQVRTVVALLVSAAALGLSAPAMAQDFDISEIRVFAVEDGSDKLLDTEKERQEFFNQANCRCETPMKLEFRLSGTLTQSSRQFQVVAGENCLNASNPTIIEPTCQVLYGPVRMDPPLQDFFITDVDGEPLSVRHLMQNNCDGLDRLTFTISMFTKQDNGEWQEKPTKVEYEVDTVAPSSPTNPSTKGGEGQVTVSFESHTVTVTDDAGASGSGTTDPNLRGYQVLCQELRDDGTWGAPPAAATSSPAFVAPINRCPGSCEASALAGSLDGGTVPGPQPQALDGGLDASVDPLDQGLPVDAAVTPDDAAGPDDGGGTGTLSCNPDLSAAYVCSSLQTSPGSIAIGGLDNGSTYRFAVVTIDKALNPSAPTAWLEAIPELAEDFWERYKRSGGQSEGGHCFVATAAYGSYHHPQVRILRELRDRVLLRSAEGRRLVASYYRASPPAASWISRHDSARAVTRALLWPVTLAAAAHLYTAPWQKALGLGAVGLLVLLLVRRRRALAHTSPRSGGQS